MKPTLLILAAGMGSRYGGLKQMEGFGPHGETLMDYSIHDALAAGFGKVVFVIRRDFADDFRRIIGSKYESHIEIDYVFQSLDWLPTGFSAVDGRTKPWGTTHAIWCAREVVKEPFASINGDDYYGKHAYKLLAQYLSQPILPTAVPQYCVIGYPVLGTLSDHGKVARAICRTDEQGYLLNLVERLDLEKFGSTGQYVDEAGQVQTLRGDEIVSMNMWGFTPELFGQLEERFGSFLIATKDYAKTAECIIATSVGELLALGKARVRVLPTTDTWFGVTHANDKPLVMDSLRNRVARGDYPSPIWNQQ